MRRSAGGRGRRASLVALAASAVLTMLGEPALAAPAPARADVAVAARERARSIVSQPRFQPARVPQPLRRPLELAAATIERGMAWLSARLPGGRATAWALLAVPVVLVSLAVVARLARRRERGGPAGEARGGAGPAPSPGVLEREAERAERAGQLDRALRLRFAAGLLRLDRARAITLSPSLTTGEVSRRLRSEGFDELRTDFEAVAYGGRPARRDQLAAAREGWARVLSETTR